MIPILSLKEVERIEETIGIIFRNKSLLEQAFTHASFRQEARVAVTEDYERLEFLGDKVVGLVVASHLFRSFPDKAEGELTAMFCTLTCNKTLGLASTELGLDKFIRIGTGARKETVEKGRLKDYLLACVFESLAGAIYLDRGLGTVEIFLDEFLLSRLPDLMIQGQFISEIGLLQQLSQKEFKLTTTYVDLKPEGGQNDIKVFGVYIGDRLVGRGEGFNKKEAKSEAAKNALKVEFKISLS